MSYTPISKAAKKRIYKSLIEQLTIKGADQDHFIDLVNDYMGLLEVKDSLFADIKDRGVMYKDLSSVGIEMQKNNPSVKELVNVNRQMLAILKDLDINTKSIESTGSDEM